MNKNIVFVYGTLRKGFGNHDFLKNSKYIGNAITIYTGWLYVPDHIPFLNFDIDGYSIKGELYEVDNKILGIIDELEGHPYVYQRERHMVSSIDNPDYSLTIAYTYVYHEEMKHIYPKGIDKYNNTIITNDYKKYINRYME